MRKILLIVFCAFTVGIGYSQTSLNEFQYVIIPARFDFLQSADQYKLNTHTRFLFKKKGFDVFYDTETRPQEYAKNECLGLRANVANLSGLFTTKLTISLTNCKNEVVFVSKEGSSKLKDYKEAYSEALKDAFSSFNTINYTYQPKQLKDEVTKVKELDKAKPNKPTAVFVTETGEKLVLKKTAADNTWVSKKEDAIVVEESVADESQLLYAQPIENGYQLVDATPKLIMKIYKTSIPDVFLAKSDTMNGVLQKKDGEWYLESTINGKVTKQKLTIKF
jgi:hypothetical protein